MVEAMSGVVKHHGSKLRIVLGRENSFCNFRVSLLPWKTKMDYSVQKEASPHYRPEDLSFSASI